MAFIAIALIAFTPRYFAPLLSGGNPIRWALHAHAVCGFLWLALFTAQVGLIRRKNIRAHRTLGFYSLAIAVVLVATGVYVSLELFWRARGVGNAGANPVLLVNLSDMLIFGLLYSLGVYARQKTHVHKAMMFLAALCLMNAAFFRVIALLTGPGPVPVVGSHILMTGLVVTYLLGYRRRCRALPLLVKATGAIYGVVLLARVPIGLSPLWAPVSDLLASIDP
ncbi:MAG: hypothetical protein AAF610_00900 [Pseudomonadota bacterium]